jgi:hypothetical protein
MQIVPCCQTAHRALKKKLREVKSKAKRASRAEEEEEVVRYGAGSIVAIADLMDNLELVARSTGNTLFRPFSRFDLSMVLQWQASSLVPVASIEAIAAMVEKSTVEWNPVDFRLAAQQLLDYTACFVVVFREETVVVGTGPRWEDALQLAWAAGLLACVNSRSRSDNQANPRADGRSRNGPKCKHEQFPGIVATLTLFVQNHHWEADPKRRTDVARTEGFRLEDALHHLYANIPGLYEAGLGRQTVQRLFRPPRKGTAAGALHHSAVNARVCPTKNDARRQDELTHFGRTQQKLLREFFALHGQVNLSGDDMNIIQVGRPAVSRYHRQTRYYGENQGPNHECHDFPTAELGIKLGGFMVLDDPQFRRVRTRALSL